MLVDARQLADGTRLEAEVCIIGGGAAGVTLAQALATTPLRTCLLESGGLELADETQSLYEGDNVGLPYFPLDSCRLRYFGGSTNHWAGLCRPLDAIDFETRPGLAFGGWPLSRPGLDPYYERAQAVCGLGPFVYDSVEYWSQQSRLAAIPLRDEAVVTRMYQIRAVRFGEAYRDTLRQASNVHVYLNANVLEIETDATASQVSGVSAAVLAGPKFRVSANLYVLAAGGIENARLLLLSNKVRPSGLGNTHDLVGRFFMEHPHAVVGQMVLRKSVAEMALYLERSKVAEIRVNGVFALPEPILRDEQLLNTSLAVVPAIGAEPLEKLIADLRGLPASGDLAAHLAALIGDLGMADEASSPNVRHVRDGAFLVLPVSRVGLLCRGEQAPNPDSRVTLGPDRDAFGQNRVRLDWRLSPIDKHSVRRLLESLAIEIGRAGLGRLQTALGDDDAPWPDSLEGGNHHMGTTRMSRDPKTGVVDEDCRVHGVANLYIAGSSVFPTSGFANPTLTIVALALRLADHIRSRMT